MVRRGRKGFATKPGKNEDRGGEACTAEAAVRDDTDVEGDLSSNLLLDETPLEKDRRHPSRRRGRSCTPGSGSRGRGSEETCGLTGEVSSQDGGGDSAHRERRARSLGKGRGKRAVSEGPGRRPSCTQRLHPGREEQSRVRAKRCEDGRVYYVMHRRGSAYLVMRRLY